jgi:hypothetical protein
LTAHTYGHPLTLAGAGFLTLVAFASPVGAQTVSGRVNDRLSGSPIAGATVELSGVGRVLTSDAGEFRISNAQPGSYILTVRALGYTPAVVQLALRADTTVRVSLEVDPVLLDSVRVNTRFVTVHGRVVERATNRPIMDGVVYATHNRTARSDRFGSFRLRRVPAGVPFEISVRAFSYESQERRLVPERDTTVTIELDADTMIHRLIQQQTDRLDGRLVNTVGKGYAVSRDRLLGSPHGGMLVDALAWVMATAPYSRSNPSLCLFVDEKQVPGDALHFLVPEEIERVEYLHDGGTIRIYTRQFMALMTMDSIPLRRPGYSAIPRGMRGRIGPPRAVCN